MIPRVRLKYIQGLASAHEELHRPREVDLTTDGELLIVAGAGFGRPLIKVPLTAVERVEVVPQAGPTTATNKVTADLTGTENVIVLQIRPAAGVPSAVAGQPIVFADPYQRDVATRLGAIKTVLVPRTPAEMAVLREGERHWARNFTIVVLALVVLVAALLVAVLTWLAAPRPRDAFIPGGPVQTAYPLLATGAG